MTKASRERLKHNWIKMKKIFLWLIGWTISSSAVTGQEAPFTIYQTVENNRKINLGDLTDACAEADVVFFGEQHDDSLGHVLQDTLFQLLHEKRDGRIALSLEMFETDVQPVLNEYLAGFIPESRLKSDARPWGNYDKHYRPMVEFAKEKGLSVIAANPPRRYVSLVGQRGMAVLDSLPKTALSFLPPLPYDTLSGRYHEKFWETMGSHGARMSHTVYHSQSLWDAGMSYSIARYWRKHKKELIYHLCGRFHSDEWLGTVAQLRQRKPKLNILTISCFPADSEDGQAPEKFGDLADFVIIH